MKKNNKKNKKGNNILNFIKTNKSQISCLVFGLVIGALIMILFFPKRIATLANGEQVILEVEGKQVTANELYEKIKLDHGTETLFTMIDEFILKQKYPKLDEEASAYVEENAQEIYTSYEQYYGYTKDEFLASNGFENDEEFKNYLKEQYYYQKYFDDYVDATITDKDIDDYYKKHVFGERSAYVFTSTDADNDLEAIRKALKKGTSFTKIQEKYNNVYSYSYDSLTFADTATLSQTILDKIGKTKKGKYSEVFEDDSFGYVVVYVLDAKSKPALEDIKDKVKEMIRVDKQENDEKLYYAAFIDLREEYGLTIYDDEFKKAYADAKKEYK